MSLRQKQRVARRQAILFAAGDLFATKGFETTSLEDVAVSAELSVPTIYTFFKSKQELLLGLLEEDGVVLEPKLAAIIDDLPVNPVDAFFSMGQAIIVEGYDVGRKNVWREILAASLKVGVDQGNQLRVLQSVSADYIGTAIDRLQKKGSLASDLDRASAVRVIHGIIRRVFQIYVVNDEVSLDDMTAMLLSDLKTILTGLSREQHA